MFGCFLQSNQKGEGYDVNTLVQTWPETKKAETFNWQTNKTEGLSGVKKESYKVVENSDGLCTTTFGFTNSVLVNCP